MTMYAIHSFGYDAIIDWVRLGFPKRCIVGYSLICLIGLRYDELGGQTDKATIVWEISDTDFDYIL